MRTRILKALDFALQPAPDTSDYRYKTWHLANTVNKKDRQNNWQLMSNPNRLRIMTIDALATFLCRQTPMLTHFGAQPEVCDQAQPFYQLAAERLFATIIREKKWQKSLNHLLLHLDNQVNKLERLFSHLLAHRDQWLPHIIYCYTNPEALREQLESGLKNIVLEKMHTARSQLPQEFHQTLLLLARHAGTYCKDNNPDNPITLCENWTPSNTPSLSDFPSWFGLANLLLTKSGDWRKTVTIRSGFHAKDENKDRMLSLLAALQSEDALKDTLAEILACPPAIYNEQQWETVTALTQLLPLLAAELTLVFQERGQIDFVELNLAALKALGTDESPTDLALYLDYQIHHLLIDEFQDTSVVHMQMLEKITAGWEPDDGRTLFLVGDPMQSIYRFRNAEVGLFLRTQTQGVGNIPLEPLTLTMNFRSEKGLVTWFNDTFQHLFPKSPDIATGRVTYTPAIAANESDNPKSVTCYPLLDSDDANEANTLLSVIQKYQKETPNDSVAILVRSRSQLSPIIEALHTAQIPFHAIDIEPLAARPEIQDLLSLTRALLHRADRIAWLSVLRSPFCGCTLADLQAITNHAGKLTLWEGILDCEKITALSEDGLNRLHRIKTHVQEAFLNRDQLPLAHWIEGCWIMLGGPATLTSPIEMNHTRAYFKLLDKMSGVSSHLRIEHFVEALQQLFAEPNTTINSQIQIMTIHKSKGLEFDHILLPSLHRQTPSDSEKLFRWLERPNAFGDNDLILAPIKSSAENTDGIYHYLKLVENKKLDHEMTRVLYVAATRAKKSLHLFSQIKSVDNKPGVIKPAKHGSFLEKLWPLFDPIIKTALLKNLKTQTETHEGVTKIQKLFHRLSSDWVLPALMNDIKLHTNESEKRVRIAIDLPSQQARITGTMIHEVLQNIAETGLTDWESRSSFPIKQWKSRLLALGLLPQDIQSSIETMHLAITKILSDERGRWILSSEHQSARCEWALTTQSDEGFQQIVIDRTFIDSDNTRWIIDYKTATPADESIADFLNSQKLQYQSQLETYARTIEHIEKCPIKLGLYFPLCQGWVTWSYQTNYVMS